jgi:valyl-tRNA synthetase
VRTEMNVPPSRKAEVYIVSENEKVRAVFESLIPTYQTLAMASSIHVQADQKGIAEDAVSVVIPDAAAFMPLSDLVDFEKERARLEKEEKRLQGELKRSHGMLSNEKFLSKAPEAKVQEEKDKLAKYEKMLSDVQKRLSELKG